MKKVVKNGTQKTFPPSQGVADGLSARAFHGATQLMELIMERSRIADAEHWHWMPSSSYNKAPTAALALQHNPPKPLLQQLRIDECGLQASALRPLLHGIEQLRSLSLRANRIERIGSDTFQVRES